MSETKLNADETAVAEYDIEDTYEDVYNDRGDDDGDDNDDNNDDDDAGDDYDDNNDDDDDGDDNVDGGKLHILKCQLKHSTCILCYVYTGFTQMTM